MHKWQKLKRTKNGKHINKGVIIASLRTQIQEHKEGIIAFLRQVQREAQYAAIPPVPRDGDFPLSFAQQRLWFPDRLGSRAVYNMPVALQQTRIEVAGLAAHIERLRLTQALQQPIAIAAEGREEIAI